MENKAVLVVSFGTSHLDALEKCIEPLEKDIAAKFPGYRFARAFTSGMIIKKLRERDGLQIDDVPAALGRLLESGCREVIIQPSHIIKGDEYHKLSAQAESFADRFESLIIGEPLLCTEEDFYDTARAVLRFTGAPAEDEAIMLMGHGSGHHAGSAYAQMEYVFHDLGAKNVFLGTVEGFPRLEQMIRRLEERSCIKSLRLLPLMTVAGDHAKNDMAGSGDSWASALSRLGYSVKAELRGLGEYPDIRKIFARHAISAAEGALS